MRSRGVGSRLNFQFWFPLITKVTKWRSTNLMKIFAYCAFIQDIYSFQVKQSKQGVLGERNRLAKYEKSESKVDSLQTGAQKTRFHFHTGSQEQEPT